MPHFFNKKSLNESFNFNEINLVWQKGKIEPGMDPQVWRKDSCGAWMKKSDYGNTNSEFGWEIDHIKPVSKGGNDSLSNLQPLQWENNRSKGDSWPNWEATCSCFAK